MTKVIRIEIVIGRILRECLTSKDRNAHMGVCSFVLQSNGWISIDNTSDSILHVLLPGSQGDKLFHIEKSEAVVYELDELLSRGWQEPLMIVKADEIIPLSIRTVQGYSSKQIEMDFFKADLQKEGVRILEDQYVLSEIVWTQIVTNTGQKETTYMAVIPKEETIFPYPWSKLFLDKEGEKQIRLLVSFQNKNKKEEKKMGFISTLLSGGILIGKICQGIAGALSSMAVDEETGLMVSTQNLVFDDVKFMMLKGSSDTTAKLTALNCSDSTKRIQFPADANGNSLMSDIPGGEKVVVEEQIKRADPTDVIEISTAGDLSGIRNEAPSAKVLLNGLHIGKETSKVFVYGFTFCVEDDGIWIGGGSVATLNYLRLSSESGVSIMYNHVITSTASGELGKFFPVEWSLYGLKTGDILSGELHFTYGTNDARNVQMLPSQPLTAEEKEFLRKQGIL